MKTAQPFSSNFLLIDLMNPKVKVALLGFGLLAIFLVFMAAVQFATPDLPDNDGYYHIKLAYLMRTEGLKPAFPYLPLSVLNPREYVDHHFLFHVFLIPFTFGDLRLGAKWASVIFAGLAFLSVWLLLHRQQVPWAPLWALGLLAVSEAFIFRMSITRAQSLSLAFLAIGLILLLEGRYRWLTLLGFLYVWFYNAFPLILGLAGAYWLAVLLLERRFEWRALLYTALGVGLGLIINPYFPQNLVFLFHHLAPKLTETTGVSVGSEWYPYDTGQLLSNSLLSLGMFAIGVVALGLNPKRMDLRTATGLFLALGFGLLLFQSRRFIEYFPAFVLIFTAFSCAPLIEQNRVQHAGAQGEGVHLPARRRSEIIPALLLVTVILLGGWFTFRQAQQSLRYSKEYTFFQGASAWLTANTAPGERVFQTDWDDFPRLFFYNTHNTYLVGLDPTYMQLYSPALYDEWVAITRGQVEQPSQAILGRFGARFVVSDLEHGDFIRQAQADPVFREVYRDDASVVFEIR
jgi:hypothetical protein